MATCHPTRTHICPEQEVPVAHLDSQTEDGQHGGSKLNICESILTFLSLVILLATFPLSVWNCVKVIQEYERAVVFRLGRVLQGGAKGPGLCWVIPWLDDIHIVDMRTVSFNIPPQEALTADLVPVTVDGVMFYRVVEPCLWMTRLEAAHSATHFLAQCTLRATLGRCTLGDLLAQRHEVALRMERVLDGASQGWGVQVERVEVKNVSIPLDLQRSMAAEAEAIREARAKMILAEGEVKAARALREAGSVMSSPIAMQLRYLQSLSDAVTNDTHTIVFPFPIDLLRGLSH